MVRIKYDPGEQLVIQGHHESVAVFLTDAHAKFTYPDGRSEDIASKRWIGTAYGRLQASAGKSKLRLGFVLKFCISSGYLRLVTIAPSKVGLARIDIKG